MFFLLATIGQIQIPKCDTEVVFLKCETQLVLLSLHILLSKCWSWDGKGGVVAELVFVNPQIQIFYVELGYFWRQLFSGEMSSRKKDKN